jgi:hypothetical protein
MNIQYQNFISESFIGLIKTILKRLSVKNDLDIFSLYVSYRTDHNLVILSERMKKYYPHEITIVLEYQFDNLIVSDDGFSVDISFNNILENIFVPFSAIFNISDNINGFNMALDTEILTKHSQKKLKSIDDLDTKLINNKCDNVITLGKFKGKS